MKYTNNCVVQAEGAYLVTSALSMSNAVTAEEGSPTCQSMFYI